MQLRQAIIQVNDRTYPLIPNRANSFEELYVDFRQEAPERGGGMRYHIFLHPKQDLVLRRLELQFEVPTQPGDRFFRQGFQSNSASRLMPVTKALPAWTYTYFQPANEGPCRFFGSLSERTGFTLLEYDQPSGLLTVRKDLDHLPLAHSFPILDLWVDEGPESDLFDRYFQAMEVPSPAAKPALCWLIAGRSKAPLSEEIVIAYVEQLRAHPLDATADPAYVLIDAGWSAAIGDWHPATARFPGGMGDLATRIRDQGYLPALWLAPFAAEENADLVKKHPDWLLKDRRGRPIHTEKSARSGRPYYALDFYNPAFRDYLSGIFHIATEKWKYELLEVDFLSAVCLAPPPGKTAGAVMYEALEFLRQLAGNKRLLVNRSPLGPAFGLADYCRISGSVRTGWTAHWLDFFHRREREAAWSALQNIVHRWQLNGRSFQTSTGAITLLGNHRRFSAAQQYTALIIQVLLNSLLVLRDNPAAYSPEQRTELEAALSLRGSQVHLVREIETGLYALYLEQENEAFIAFCNLTRQVRSLPASLLAGRIEIQPGETLVLRRAADEGL